MRLFQISWWPPPMVIAITATICAAGLVLFLQHRAISTLESQTRVILRQISEQTAADIAVELRRTLDGPVFDTLTAVNHPELRAGRLDLVAQQFAEGLSAYPHVDRFFAWNTQTESTAAGEVVFYGRGSGGFARDPALGRAIVELARTHAPSQQIYVAAEGIGAHSRLPRPPRASVSESRGASDRESPLDGARGDPERVDGSRGHQVFLRLFWTDARRLEYFAMLGFVVEPSRMREQLLGPSRSSRLEALLTRRSGDLPLQLTVTDEHGALVYGMPTAGTVGGRVPFPMVFYPADEIHSRLAAGVEPRVWAIEVTSSPASGAFARATHGYGPTALSVVLMLVALGLTIQAHRRSADLAQMQTDFVAHVSHQLKTPLSLLSAATETLQMDRVRSPERFAEYLATIHAEAARLSLLVQRVLEFSRMQQRRSYEFERVDLGALVGETVDAFAHGLSTRQFTFDVQQDGPSPFVQADPAALEQVLANLLDNAVKYSATVKEITVRVRTSRTHAIVEISDRGAGIAPGDQGRIFERFYRTSGTQHRPGFGLGLPIVRELIHAHHGRVEVVSAPGEGSTFRIVLPRDTAERRTEDAAPVELPKGAS